MTYRPLGIAPRRALGEEYSPMWVDVVAQKGALPTATITRDAVTSLWRNSPGYYYLNPGTFKTDTGKPGVYGAQVDVAMPVATTGGALEFMSLPVTLSLPVDAIIRDVANSKLVQEKLGASTTIAGGVVGGMVLMTAGVTLLGVWLLLKYGKR